MAEVLARGWYVVHTQTGHEDKVKSLLEREMGKDGVRDKIFRVMIPSEEVVDVRKNKKRLFRRKFFPGYVLVDMQVDEQTYWLVRAIPGVTGFLGEPKPTPLQQDEVQSLLDFVETSAQSKPKPAVQFEKGESVRIIEGPFRHFLGVVEEVNESKAKIKAMVTIFGRPTPVELDFLQVEKV